MNNDNQILDNLDMPEYWQESTDVVAKYYSAQEANVAAARLRSEGIPCFLANEASQTSLTSVQSYVRLHVLPKNIDQARLLLHEAAIEAEPPHPTRESIAEENHFLWILYAILATAVCILIWQYWD